MTAAKMAAPAERSAYAQALAGLVKHDVPFLVGGSYAFVHYTGVVRPTKDLDLFVTRQDRSRLLAAFEDMGWRTHVAFDHWLAKAKSGAQTIDVIHGSGNGVAMVDTDWFAHARAADVLGVEVRLTPPEEMIWSKAFVMEKYRYDGADVAHLLLRQAEHLDWPRLRLRFGRHYRVLLAHLVLLDFIYPGRRLAPPWLQADLMRHAAQDSGATEGAPVCQGVLLSRKQYRTDVEKWGMRDARLDSDVAMTPRDILDWTTARPGPAGPDA